jgi:hypothetical protein
MLPLLIQIDIQSEILVHLKAHLRVERAVGKEVTPAMNKVKTSDKFLHAETRKYFVYSLGKKIHFSFEGFSM